MILVTGATGLVGGNLLWYLLQQNERVTAIRRSSSDLTALTSIFRFYTIFPENFLAKIDWINADVMDYETMNLAMKGIKKVYHCAAQVLLGSSNSKMLDTNIIGTKNVVEAALQNAVSKLCFVSSIAACGKAANQTIIDENGSWNEFQNHSYYAQSKYLSEQEVWKGIQRGLNAVIVNPGVILGVSGRHTGSSQLFYQVQKGLAFYTKGGSGYVDVRDVVQIMIQLQESEICSERFILVGDNCSNKDILTWMAEGFNKPRPFIGIGKNSLIFLGYLSEKLGKLFNFVPLIDVGTARAALQREYYNSKKIRKALNFQFFSIEKCIKKVCEFQNKIV